MSPTVFRTNNNRDELTRWRRVVKQLKGEYTECGVKRITRQTHC